MKLSLLFLVLISFALLALSKLETRRPDKYSYILSQMSQPYTNVFKVLHDRASNNLKYLKQYLENDLKAQNNSKKEREYILIAEDSDVQENNINSENNLSRDDEEPISGRILADPPCKNNGQYVSATVKIYTCNTVIVPKSTYDALEGKGCSTSQSSKMVCYCSYDTYGDTCEEVIDWKCQIEKLSHPSDCKGRDTHDYVYSYSGSPPCYVVEEGQTISVVTRVVCSFLDTTYAFEGVKHSKYEIVTQPTVTYTFPYQVQGTKFKLTTIPDKTHQQIAFTDWKRMSFPAIFKTTLNGVQLAGNDVIVTDIIFTKTATNFAYSGRYYYETAIMVDKTDKSSNYAGGFFEQAGYVEPPPRKKGSKTLGIVLGVLGAVIVITALIGYNVYQRRKNRINTLTTDVQPLMDDDY